MVPPVMVKAPQLCTAPPWLFSPSIDTLLMMMPQPMPVPRVKSTKLLKPRPAPIQYSA